MEIFLVRTILIYNSIVIKLGLGNLKLGPTALTTSVMTFRRSMDAVRRGTRDLLTNTKGLESGFRAVHYSQITRIYPLRLISSVSI